MISIRPATLRDASFIASHMRQADAFEIAAVVAYEHPAIVAAILLEASPDLAWVAFVNGQPVTCFGVAPLLGHVATGWAFGTNRLKRTIPAITKFSLGTVVPRLIARGFHRLEVRTYIGHDLSHKWLGGMGFSREGICRAYGRHGEDFALYAATRPLVKVSE